MHVIKINRNKRLSSEPHLGHNRWHPDLTPVIAVDPGEIVRIETRDAADGQIKMGMTVDDFASLGPKVAHPLTGPIFVNGAEPGDLLEIEFVDFISEPYGWTRIRPGGGFLRGIIDEPFLAHWTMKDGWARSAELPGVRIPEGAFMGTAGVAPSHAQLKEWTAREAEVVKRGGLAQLPDPEDAVPSTGPIAHEGLRTTPPRENGGNMDIKNLTKGSKLFIPVAVDGALFSCGDAHYAQGDSECCITAIEMGATVDVRFALHKQQAAEESIKLPRFAHSGMFAEAKWAAPANFIATIGLPLDDDGVNQPENVTLAARNALLNMIDLLAARGWSRTQAYAICSVAMDLRISSIVNAPNVVVSAILPEGIFE